MKGGRSKFSKKIVRKEKGVSEVLGSLLVLAITVLLFSTVFYYVNTLPTPKAQTYAQFNAKLNLVNVSGSLYANITVENVGGESLKDWQTEFIVVIDTTAKQYMLSQPPLSTQAFDKDGKFSQGEAFYYNSSWDGITVSQYSDISVMLYDMSTQQVIWSAKLLGQANTPPIAISIYSIPGPIKIGSYARIYAIIFDPDYGDDVSKDIVGVDLSSLNMSSYVPMQYSGNNLFSTNPLYFNDTNLDPRKPYVVTVYVKDTYGRNVSYKGYLYITKGTNINGPDLFVDPNLIVMSTENPTHMNDVTVTVTVQNRGGVGATFKLEVYDEYSTYPNGQVLIQTNLGNPLPAANQTYTVSAAGQTTITFIWKEVGTNSTGASLGPVAGNHKLLVKVIDIHDIYGNPGEDPNAKYPNEAVVDVTVLPKILFVDDDQAIQGSDLDVSQYYEYILDTCNYEYDTKIWTGTIYYDTTLSYYDVVIWETGYSTSTIDATTQAPELYKFYASGGALWLISPELSSTTLTAIDPALSSYAAQYTGNIVGDATNPDVNLTLPNGNPITEPLINDRTTASNVQDVRYINGGTPLIRDVSGNVLTVTDTNANGGKIVYMGFEFSRIEHYYGQYFIGYRILQWLGNISSRVGTDVAVDDMIISTTHPLYMQPVNITVIVSNNGGSPVSTSVLLKIDGVVSPDIVTANPNNTGIIPPDGGFVTVNFTWIPKSPGKHVITVMADPYNFLKETNEENNMLNSLINNIVYVEFSTLLIYNTSLAQPTHVWTVEQAFNDTGYKYKTLNVYDYYSSKAYPATYTSGEDFTKYNLVIWIETADNAVGVSEPLGVKDAKAVYNSVSNAKIGFLFIGGDMPRFLEDAIYNTATNSNLLDYFYLSYSTNPALTGGGDYVFFGVNNPNSITNGASYIISVPTGGTIYTLSSSNPVNYGLLRDPLPPTTDGSDLESTYLITSTTTYTPTGTYYGIAAQTSTNIKIAVLPFNMTQVLGIYGLRYSDKPVDPARQSRAEIVYRLTKFFGLMDSRPELAVYAPEISIESELPNIVVGHSYMIRVTVYNYGFTGASTVVRFYDDYEWIGTQSVYVPANNKTYVEIVWTPMFASKTRHLRVVVDPLNEVSEVKNSTLSYELFNYNNEAIKTVTVWYFWDNMEYGARNWRHEATIMDINGESPLDFINRPDTSTNVVGSWDTSLSSGWYWTNNTLVTPYTHNASHSTPAAFWLPEVPVLEGKRKPIDLIIVIDSSGSMAWSIGSGGISKIDAAKQAAEAAVGILRSNDRIAIFDFTSSATPNMLLNFTYTNTTADRANINSTISSITANGATPLFDTVSYAEWLMYKFGRPDAVKGIIILTDGISNNDYLNDANSPSTYPQHAFQYAPGDGYGEEPDEPGPVQPFMNGTGNGLLGIPYNVFTISIGPLGLRTSVWASDGFDARLHSISLTSPSKIHFGVVTSNASALQDLFEMFVQSLLQVSTGGIRAVAPGTFTSGYNAFTALRATNTIKNLPVVVFADSFRSENFSTPGTPWSSWSSSGATILNYTTFGWDYHVSAELQWSGSYISHRINPEQILSELPGTYSLKQYNLTLYVDGKVDIYVSPDGATWNYVDTITSSGRYYLVNIPLKDVNGINPFYLKIIAYYDTIIDDVIVSAYIDYVPPSGTGAPSGYSSVINTNLKWRYLITKPVSLDNASSVSLSFWTKYWDTQGTNGGVVYLWGSPDGTTWQWLPQYRYYLIPTQGYTGNLRFSGVNGNATTGGPTINGVQSGLIDANNNLPYWCFNGVSGHGTFTWDYITVNLTQYASQFKAIRIVFLFAQFGGITPNFGWTPEMGWYLDDVKIEVTGDGVRDVWKLVNFGSTGPTGAHSGDYAWAYENATGDLPVGVDSSLISKQIDLTTARNVTLNFWIRFNINPAAGVPPATVRVEISDDNGMTWNSITYGVRIGWGSSGHGDFSGVADDGSTSSYNWVKSTTLLRINCDLSGWAGKIILIRFRIATNATSYPSYDPSYPNDPHGVFIDDVFIFGESNSPEIPATSSYYLWI